MPNTNNSWEQVKSLVYDITFPQRRSSGSLAGYKHIYVNPEKEKRVPQLLKYESQQFCPAAAVSMHKLFNPNFFGSTVNAQLFTATDTFKQLDTNLLIALRDDDIASLGEVKVLDVRRTSLRVKTGYLNKI